MLDDIDRRLVEVLIDDGRISLKALARHVGLSSPSVSERLRRLEERGIIRGFTVDIDPKANSEEMPKYDKFRTWYAEGTQ